MCKKPMGIGEAVLRLQIQQELERREEIMKHETPAERRGQREKLGEGKGWFYLKWPKNSKHKSSYNKTFDCFNCGQPLHLSKDPTTNKWLKYDVADRSEHRCENETQRSIVGNSSNSGRNSGHYQSRSQGTTTGSSIAGRLDKIEAKLTEISLSLELLVRKWK